MSSNDLDPGGSTDGGTSAFPTDGGTVTLQLPRDRIAQIAKGVVLGLIPGWVLAFQTWREFTAFLEDFVIRTVVAWIVEDFVAPIVQTVLEVFGLVIDAILVVAFGTDKVIGGSPGLADLVVYVATLFVSTTAPVADAIIGIIWDFNEMVAGIAAQAGIAAPIVVTALAAVEIVGGLYVVWSIIRVINLPLVDVDDAISAVFAPFKALFRRLT